MTLLIGAAVLAVIYWAKFVAGEPSWAKSMVKTGAVAILAIAGLVHGGPWLLVGALALSAVGDWALSRDGDGIFMAGVGAFALAHLAYAALFLTHADADMSRIFQPRGLGITGGLLALGVVMISVLWRRAGDLRGAVSAYVPVILSMGIVVQALPATGPIGAAHWAAALFILSDLVLAFELFVLRPGTAFHKLAPFAVWPLYWSAQALFLFAFTGGFAI